MVTAFSGKDTIKINDRILNDFGDGDVFVLDYDSDLIAVKKGKTGNSIYTYNAQGEVAKGSLRLVRGSPDDKFLNDLLNLMKNDPSAFSLLTGEFVKNIGDGAGGITNETYILSGGAFKKLPGGKDNVEGDAEASVIIYEFLFGSSPRSVG
jgi:hypothetical protein